MTTSLHLGTGIQNIQERGDFVYVGDWKSEKPEGLGKLINGLSVIIETKQDQGIDISPKGSVIYGRYKNCLSNGYERLINSSLLMKVNNKIIIICIC